ncbi:acyltransferase family protein [Brevibacterium spongiae]|uniref:Acyltransferase n=1 Tax=Brevibacterium spongiae TaxID=2909672 RepID=A0ABY5SNN8_9MICO|nr:acyltransferase [Brevibacterium spongiae]UVI35750.1 acyltransferase [Brevibacterium spongiae]
MTVTLTDSLPPDDHRERVEPRRISAGPRHREQAQPRRTSAKPTHPAAKPRRDPALDLVRFGCLVVVVVLHSMMSAAVLGPDGTVVPTVALSDTAGFAAASWLFQIMPLFFIIGGCAGIIGWRRTRAQGGTWADHLRARLRRLIVPVTVLIALAGLGLSVAGELGVPSALLTEASHRIGQPLWFLAVYIGLTALVPVAVHFHETAPRRSLALLAGAVIVVDGLIAVTGVSGLGYLNFLFVWPLVQQLGFFYADALSRPVRRPLVWSVLVAALLTLIGLVAAGVYSPNMLVNLNPPTGALVLLGVVQMCAMRLIHARLNRMLTEASDTATEAAPEPRALRAQIWRRVIDWGNQYGMQVYLWHMSVVIVLIGGLGALAQVVSGMSGLSEYVLPEIGSGWWWASRLPWLLVVMGISALVAVLTERIPFPSERRLASVGRRIGGLFREMRGNAGAIGADEGAGDAGADDRTGDAGSGDRTGPSPQLRAVAAVGAATAGVAIALLIGIAPLIWTVLASTLLLGSLIIAAALDSGAVTDSGATTSPGATTDAGATTASSGEPAPGAEFIPAELIPLRRPAGR